MIKIVNSILFSGKTEKGTNTYGEHFKTEITPAVEPKDGKIHRIVTIMSATKDYNENNIMVNSKPNPAGNMNVLIKSFDNNKIDMHLYLVAFPFNGLMSPILESSMYRIHRGYLQTFKDKAVKFNGEMYKKVLYLLVEPNVTLFDPRNKNCVESISIPFISYNLNSTGSKDSADATTVKTVMTLTMLPNGDFTTDWISVDVEPVDKSTLSNAPLYSIYIRKDRVAADSNYTAKVTDKFQRNGYDHNNDHHEYRKPKNTEIQKLGYKTASDNGKRNNSGNASRGNAAGKNSQRNRGRSIINN